MASGRSSQPLTVIKTKGYRQRNIAKRLIRSQHTGPSPATIAPSKHGIKVICISDTHNRQPVVPPGDVLIHSGDLTENGSFQEMQDGLTWLSSLPHKHKIFVAGNHDVLLDEEFLERYPERRYGAVLTKRDLDWGDIVYLQDSATTLEFQAADGRGSRCITIFGSPWTPQYGVSAFQYRPDNPDYWDAKMGTLDREPDLVVTHGPPRLHLDKRDFHRAGCPYLAEQIRRARPRLCVFGHIHASYGREDVVLNRAQGVYESVMTGWAGWGGVVWLAALVLWEKAKALVGLADRRATTFVNAAVVAGPNNELRNEPIVVEV